MSVIFSHKQHFRDGFRDAVAGEPADAFWDPRLGAWGRYPPERFTVTDEGLATVDFEPEHDSDAVFDVIQGQWGQLRADRQNASLWDPRRRRWVLFAPVRRGA